MSNERICKTCYQYEDDHHAKFATSWDWCRENDKFIKDYHTCEKHKTYNEAVRDGSIIVVSKQREEII